MKKILLLLVLFTSMLSAQNIPSFIEGKVLSKTSFWQNKNIYTRNVIQTDNGNRTIITKGGIIGLNAEVVSDSPTLQVGQRGKFKIQNDNLLSVENIITESSLSVTSISPTSVPAGVGQTVTITGTNFGARNIVQFANADYGGALYTNALDSAIISWTDTEIVIKVPDFAGTGIIKVLNLNGDTFESPILTVPYANINLGYDIGEGEVDYQTHHVNLNGNGGLTWQYNNAFSNDARLDFADVLLKWACESKMNWEMGNDTAVDVIALDGVSVVRFSTSGEMSLGTLGVCTSRFQGCFEDGVIKWYVVELDIIFNIDQNWSYGDIPVNGFSSFKTVALHEIGHGRQLGHVIDNNKVMHFALAAGIVKLTLTPSDIDGGLAVQTRSTAGSVCVQDILEDFNCSLSIVKFDTNDFKIYPNPATTKLVINGDFDKILLIDMRGVILTTTTANEIPLNYAKGLYLLKVEKGNQSIVKKIIIN